MNVLIKKNHFQSNNNWQQQKNVWKRESNTLKNDMLNNSKAVESKKLLRISIKIVCSLLLLLVFIIINYEV